MISKEEAIEQLGSIKQDIFEMDRFAGQAIAIRKIDEKISFLFCLDRMKYKALDKLPELFVKEAKKLSLP